MLTTYTTDGTQTRFTFNWPYLDRAHIMVTRDTAPAMFKFIGDYEVEVKTLFGEPLPAGEVLKIFRVTPDLVSFAEFKDASNLSAQDLNRARLQVLFLIQERSGGIAGSVSQVVQLLVNEIETLSGALDSLQYSQGLLTAGLQTIDELGTRITVVENEGDALSQAINDAIENFDGTLGAISTRMDTVEAQQNNLQASVSSQIATLVSNDLIQASRVDTLKAQVDAIDADEGTEALAASLIQAAVAQVKNGVALAQRIETLEVQVGDDIQALIQQEQTARASADEALAQQITTLQATINDNIAQVIEDMSATVEAVDGKVTNLNAQYTLKAQVQRADGKKVMAGIGLAATANNDMSGSEIVMMADRLVFADPNAPEGTLRPMFVAGNVDGSPTFIIPSNAMGDRTYPGRLLVDGSIEGRSVAANTITGDKLKAGSITTREIDVNLGVNLLVNSTFVQGLDAWSTGDVIGGGQFGINGAGAAWAPVGGFAATIFHGNINWNGTPISDRYAEIVTTSVPVAPGDRYEFSVYTGMHRCYGRVYVQFLDASGNPVSAAASTEDNSFEASGGQLLSSWKRLYGFAVAPSNAASAKLIIRKGPTLPGYSDSWGMYTLPFLATANPNQTRPSPWTPSGLGTKITPNGISTPSLSALTAVIGLLRTASSGARLEIESNQIRAYDGNNVMRVRMGVW
ncbi:phage tail fiber domain-containing protein [Variovorax paradoxus]|uniref:phage tail fiber domain-containing protein n=1 Tax=Variovorax paradoxus TaxID=34073 RepID=UPI00285EB54A|nr:phage tail fiber protein [Variovorax paradoxus]MDR6455493.1 hypothetical protein [Variovorax paradoxus]